MGRRFNAALATMLCTAMLHTGQAPANHVQCGDVITADATLDSDLVDCATFGVEIAQDGVELDLNGHVIDGQGADPFVDYAGVSNSAGHDAVTIRNGAIREFDTGVLLGGGFQPGVGFFGANSNVVRRLSISDVEHGVVGFEADANVIAHNVTRANQGGITLLGVTTTPAADSNSIVRNNTGPIHPTRVAGGGIYAHGNRNFIAGNATRNGSITAAGDENLIARNSVSLFVAGSGLVADGAGNMVRKNVSFQNNTGISLRAGAYVRAEKNIVFENRGDGIQVSGRALLARNRALRNGDDGIHVMQPGARLAKNRADENGDYGIEATPGTIDAGGNRASGNGNPSQCLNVACK